MMLTDNNNLCCDINEHNVQDAVLSQGGPRDAAVHFDTYRILQQHRVVSLPQNAFLVGLCLQTALELSVKK